MKINSHNQLVLRSASAAREPSRCTSNMISVRGDLYQPIEIMRIRTGMNTREIVNVLLEYALANVQLVEEEE